MKKLKKFKFVSFLVLIFFSLFCFSACADADLTEEKILEQIGKDTNLSLKLIYRPFGSHKFGEKTYNEIVNQALLDLSDTIITGMVGQYGYGEIEMDYKDPSLPIERLTPELGTNFDNFIGMLSLDISPNKETAKREKGDLAVKFSGIKNVFYSQETKFLGLSREESASSLVTTNGSGSTTTYTANLPKTSGTLLVNLNQNMPYSHGATLPHGVYLYTSKTGYAFLFLGDKAPISAGLIKGYIQNSLSSNFGRIQQNVVAGDITDLKTSGESQIVSGAGSENKFHPWKYSIEDNDLTKILLSSDPAANFLKEYKTKHLLSYAVEIAKVFLTFGGEKQGGVNLPTKMEELYTRATQDYASKTDKEAFLKEASEYLSHMGILPSEVEPLTEALKNNIIGTLIAKNNYEMAEFCATYIKDLQEKISYKPILEMLSTNEGALEELEIPGYIQSIMYYKEESAFDFSGFLALFKSYTNAERLETLDPEKMFPTIFTMRHKNKESLIEYPVLINKEDFKQNFINISVSDFLSTGKLKTDKSTIDPFPKVEIKENEKYTTISTIDENYSLTNWSEIFTFSKDTENTKGYCWCIKSADLNFVELTFATDNMTTNQIFDFEIV